MDDELKGYQKTRRAILEATSKILEEEGLSAALPTRIWEATGIARSTIYRHWPDRVALIEDALKTKRYKTRTDAGARSNAEEVLRRTKLELEQPSFIVMLCAVLEQAARDERWDGTREHMLSSRTAELEKVLSNADTELAQDEMLALLLGPILYYRLVFGQRLGEAPFRRLVDLMSRLFGASSEEEDAADAG